MQYRVEYEISEQLSLSDNSTDNNQIDVEIVNEYKKLDVYTTKVLEKIKDRKKTKKIKQING